MDGIDDRSILQRTAPNPRPIDPATLPRRNHTTCLLLGAVLKTSAREHLLPSGRDLNRRQSPNLYFVCGYFISAAGASKIVPPLYCMETILPADVAVGRELVARQGQHTAWLCQSLEPQRGRCTRATTPARRHAEPRSLPQSPCSPALHLDEPTTTE